ncbi:MAG: hypothetical protein AAB225_20165 [Acidobacteriota bacterium]
MRLLPVLLLAAWSLRATTFYVTVAGLGGEPDYEQRFSSWAQEMEKILKASGGDSRVETLHGAAATRARVRQVLEGLAREVRAEDALVLVLIGHGAFDGFEYKFNLPGPDLSDSELASLLEKIRAQRQLVVITTSASGAAIELLRKENRVVITATKSGTEKNATVFARYWVEGLRDPSADTDKNEAISALEAFRYAAEKTAKFYEGQKRLATEHPLLEDTGKGAGTRSPSLASGEGRLAAAFTVARFGRAQAAAADPARRALLARKEELEQQIDRLKYQKAAMDAQEYRKQLTALLLELAKTQEEMDK